MYLVIAVSHNVPSVVFHSDSYVLVVKYLHDNYYWAWKRIQSENILLADFCYIHPTEKDNSISVEHISI